MGYQESYVRMKDRDKFNALVNLIRQIGQEYYEENGVEPVEIITLNKSIKGDLSYMCKPYEKYSFPVGEKFIYFVGERYLQRSVGRLLNDINIEGIEIYFTECFPSDKIFEGNEGNKYATHQEFTWDLNSENEVDNNMGINSDDITDCRFKKEEVSLDYLIENKIVKNVLTDLELYGLESFAFSQFQEQVEDMSMSNFDVCFSDVNGVYGLFLFVDKTPIFVNDELLESIYLGCDNKIYYLTEDGNIYSYIQGNHTSANKCNKYPD
jgi:hypothetical protein